MKLKETGFFQRSFLLLLLIPVSGAGTLTLGLAGWILFDPHVSTLALALIFLGVTLLALIICGNLDRVLTLCDQRVFVREEWDQQKQDNAPSQPPWCGQPEAACFNAVRCAIGE